MPLLKCWWNHMLGGTISVPEPPIHSAAAPRPSGHISEQPSPERMITWAPGPWARGLFDWNWPIYEYPIPSDWESGAFIARFVPLEQQDIRDPANLDAPKFALPVEPDLEVKGCVARDVQPKYPLQNAGRGR
jgi:hypothetical protein